MVRCVDQSLLLLSLTPGVGVAGFLGHDVVRAGEQHAGHVRVLPARIQQRGGFVVRVGFGLGHGHHDKLVRQLFDALAVVALRVDARLEGVARGASLPGDEVHDGPVVLRRELGVEDVRQRPPRHALGQISHGFITVNFRRRLGVDGGDGEGAEEGAEGEGRDDEEKRRPAGGRGGGGDTRHHHVLVLLLLSSHFLSSGGCPCRCRVGWSVRRTE